MSSPEPEVRHEYLSTACWHELNDGRPTLHASCRATCKWCQESCSCPGHPENDGQPASPEWVDQARDIARDLLALIVHPEYEGIGLPPDLAERISTDPALFWLRGEEQPPGQWTPRETPDARS